MSDRLYCFLLNLNYVDHGVKFIFSILILRMRASHITIALQDIFAVIVIGPIMILQSDIGI
jgi:hypothetical protein